MMNFNSLLFNRALCYGYRLKNTNKNPGADVCGKCVTAAVCALSDFEV